MVSTIAPINSQDEKVPQEITTKLAHQNRQFSEETENTPFFKTPVQNKAILSSRKFSEIPTINGVSPAEETTETLQSRQFEAGNGTLVAPYQIASIDQLKELRNNETLLNDHFELLNHLNFGSSDYDDVSSKWKPIGNATHPFNGSFNGNNHQILNLQINRPSEDNIGLFGKVTGILKNTQLENVIITGRSRVGALVGHLDEGRIYSSTSGLNGYVIANATSSSYPTSLGGLVGRAEKSIINDSFSAVNVHQGYIVGGLIGFASDSIISFSATNFFYNSTDTPLYVGGLIGEVQSNVTVNNCYTNTYMELPNGKASGSGSTNLGGLIGQWAGERNIINSSFTTSVFNSTARHMGGLIGQPSGESSQIINSFSNATVERYSSGFFGGLAGILARVAVNNSYAIIAINFPTGLSTEYTPIFGGGNAGSKQPTVEFTYYSTTTPASFYTFDIIHSDYETLENLRNNISLYDVWDTENIWKVGDNQLPSLRKTNTDRFIAELNVFSSISELSFQAGSTGNELVWTISGGDSGIANVYLDEQKISETTWNRFSQFRVSTDSLSPGKTYNYTLEVQNGDVSRSSTIFVTPIDIPSLTKPSDVAYNFDETNNRIIWQSDGAENSGVATLYRNGTEIETSNWEAMSNLSFSIDDLSIGIYNFTLVLIDEFNVMISDTVMVTVNSADFRISAPTSIVYDIAASERVLTWNLTAVGTFGTASLYLNDILFGLPISWVSSSELVFDIFTIPAGSYNLRITVTDFLGATLNNIVQVNVTSFPNFAMNELTYQLGELGNFLNWTMSGTQIIGDLQLLRNGSEVFSSQWIGSQSFSQAIDGLSTGLHEFELIIIESSGSKASYTVLVRVEPPLSISSPDDLTYVLGTTGNTITWTLLDSNGKSGTAIVLLDNVQFGLSKEWSNSLLVILNVDNLQVGMYNFTIRILTSLDLEIKDTVLISIINTSPTSPTSPVSSTSPTTSENSMITSSGSFDSLFYIIIVVQIVVLSGVAAIAGYFIFKFGNTIKSSRKK